VVLVVTGEIDLGTVTALRAALHAVLGQPPLRGQRRVVVDLTAVSFCGVAGFVVLAQAAHTAAARSIGYTITGMTPSLRRHAHLVCERSAAMGFTDLPAALMTDIPPGRDPHLSSPGLRTTGVGCMAGRVTADRPDDARLARVLAGVRFPSRAGNSSPRPTSTAPTTPPAPNAGGSPKATPPTSPP
jgi:anti-anti-sigma factor